MKFFVQNSTEIDSQRLAVFLTDYLLKFHHLRSFQLEIFSEKNVEILPDTPCLSNFYILLPDLPYNGQIGFNLAKKIRNFDNLGTIIICSKNLHLISQTMSSCISALGFIDLNNDFFTQLSQLLSFSFKTNEKFLFIENKYGLYRFFKSEIYYLETSSNHHIHLFTENNIFRFRDSLTNFHKNLPDFWLIHQGFLVNPLKIRGVDRKNHQLLLINQQKIPIARDRYLQTFENFKKLPL